MSERKQVWLHVGRVSNADAYPDESVKVGDLEFQFSDGPPGQRSSSADYIDLAEGLDDQHGCDLFINHRNLAEAGLTTTLQFYQWVIQNSAS
jgi:hypothetical protein